MNMERKAVVRETVRRYLEIEASDRLEEFEVVFDDVFRVIDSRIATKNDSGLFQQSESENGIPLDTGLLVGTTISVACCIGVHLSIGALKYAGKKPVEAGIRRVAKSLLQRGADASIVLKMQDILLGILSEL